MPKNTLGRFARSPQTLPHRPICHRSSLPPCSFPASEDSAVHPHHVEGGDASIGRPRAYALALALVRQCVSSVNNAGKIVGVTMPFGCSIALPCPHRPPLPPFLPHPLPHPLPPQPDMLLVLPLPTGTAATTTNLPSPAPIAFGGAITRLPLLPLPHPHPRSPRTSGRVDRGTTLSTAAAATADNPPSLASIAFRGLPPLTIGFEESRIGNRSCGMKDIE